MFSATCKADVCKYGGQQAYTHEEKNNAVLLSTAIKLPQRCSPAHVKEANAALLAARNEQIAIISVRGTVGSVSEA